MSPPIQPEQPTPWQGREVSNADLARMISAVGKEQTDQGKRLGVIENALLGTIDPPRQGLLDQVRELRKKVGGLSKLGWAALVAAAGALGTFLVNKVTGSS